MADLKKFLKWATKSNGIKMKSPSRQANNRTKTVPHRTFVFFGREESLDSWLSRKLDPARNRLGIRGCWLVISRLGEAFVTPCAKAVVYTNGCFTVNVNDSTTIAAEQKQGPNKSSKECSSTATSEWPCHKWKQNC